MDRIHFRDGEPSINWQKKEEDPRLDPAVRERILAYINGELPPDQMAKHSRSAWLKIDEQTGVKIKGAWYRMGGRWPELERPSRDALYPSISRFVLPVENELEFRIPEKDYLYGMRSRYAAQEFNAVKKLADAPVEAGKASMLFHADYGDRQLGAVAITYPMPRDERADIPYTIYKSKAGAHFELEDWIEEGLFKHGQACAQIHAAGFHNIQPHPGNWAIHKGKAIEMDLETLLAFPPGVDTKVANEVKLMDIAKLFSLHAHDPIEFRRAFLAGYLDIYGARKACINYKAWDWVEKELNKIHNYFQSGIRQLVPGIKEGARQMLEGQMIYELLASFIPSICPNLSLPEGSKDRMGLAHFITEEERKDGKTLLKILREDIQAFASKQNSPMQDLLQEIETRLQRIESLLDQ